MRGEASERDEEGVSWVIRMVGLRMTRAGECTLGVSAR